MSRLAHFPVVGRFRGGAVMPGKLTIDRDANLVSVKPYKKKQRYELPLNAVAEFIVWHVTKVDLRDKKLAKQKARRDRSAQRRAEKRKRRAG